MRCLHKIFQLQSASAVHKALDVKRRTLTKKNATVVRDSGADNDVLTAEPEGDIADLLAEVEQGKYISLGEKYE